MAPDPTVLKRLLSGKQQFFLPYYIQVVELHPEGIAAAEVKAVVARKLEDDFGIDIFDPAVTGLNNSTKKSSGDQWANNLISNRVLDEHMLVVRDTRATLYPGAPDNSRSVPPPSPPLTDGQVSDLDNRPPTEMETQTGRAYRRSPQLAEYARERNGRMCAAAGLNQNHVVFIGRDDKTYVEVHHIIPMAVQRQSPSNLDR